MRKSILCLMGIFVISAAPRAQEFGGSAFYDFQARAFTPVVTTKLGELPDFLGFRGVTPEIRMFAGIQNARGLGGTALVFSGPLARNATWDIGIGARAQTGRKVGLGIIAGFTVKF